MKTTQSLQHTPVSEPRPVPKGFKVLRSAKDLAVESFGHVEGLLLVEATKIDLAKHYAIRADLDFDDPDVCATATLMAWTRFREFVLIQAAEKRVYEECVRTGKDYGEVLYLMIQSDSQRRVNSEIRRLHDQCRTLSRDLSRLSSD